MEIFKLNRFLRLQQVQNSGIGDFHSLTSSYSAYCQMILKRRLQSKEKLLGSITMRSRELIVDRIMGSYSAAFHTKRHKRHSGKLTTACSRLTILDLNWGTDFEDLATTSWRWSLMLLSTLDGITLVWFMVTSYIKRQDIFIQCLLQGPLRCGEWIHRTHQPTNV